MKRIQVSIGISEFVRVREAARWRKLSVSEFFREAANSVSDDTLAAVRRREIDPHGRRDAISFPVPEELKWQNAGN